MATGHARCEVKDCRRAAAWIVWRYGVDPMLLCEADRRILFVAAEGLPISWSALPLLTGAN